MNEALSPASSIRSKPESRPAVWQHLDTLIIFALLVFAVFSVAKGVYWSDLPAEDALMLMRYATHVAGGHGIVWNIGDKPVEGATDFLYLMLLSGWMKLSHLGAIWAARTFLATAQVVGVGVLYYTSRVIAGAGRAVACVLALYLAMGPGIVHTANGFSSPFYGLMALCAWAFALVIFKTGATTPRMLGFAGFALLAGLTRPDGVLLAIFMTAAIVYGLRRASLATAAVTFGVFALLGGAYFLWRFHYFGYLLPNPMYKKGGGHLYFDSLHISVTNCLKMLLPFLAVLVAGLFSRTTRRLTVFTLIPLVCFACVWILLTNENNASMRFQYVTLPFSLLSVAAISTALLNEFDPRLLSRITLSKWQTIAASLVVLLTLHLWWKTTLIGPELVGTGPYHIATKLAKYQDRSYTLLATEAGVIPYFSGWRAIDGWGLNDAEIAHNKLGLTDKYLDANQPAIIMIHNATALSKADYDRAWRGEAPPAQNVTYLVESASHYAVTHGYSLAARWGRTACEVDMWYVKRSVPEAEEFTRIIREPEYFYPYNDAGHGTNYLQAEPPSTCDDDKAVVTRRD